MKNKTLKKFVNIYPHIEEASKAVLESLRETRKTCLIMPTGSGKTLVSSIIAETLGVRTMYLCPNTYILDQTKSRYTESGIAAQFMTYPDMIGRIKSGDIDYFSGIDLFILDEFHRLGSDVWGESWRVISKKFPRSKILGLTATEFRYLDGGRDMAKELFGGNIAYELTLSECFKRGILRAPRYVIGADISSSLIEMEDKVKAIKDPSHKKEVKEMIKNLKHNWTKTKGIANFYKKHILKNPEVDLHKMIVFHEKIKSAQETKAQVTKNLRDAGYTKSIKFYIANSEVPEALEEVRKFNSEPFNGLKVLLTVNMCNEGLHVDGCTVEVMYRSTMSKNIYLQQVGRVMSLGCKTQPVILDLVQNVSLSDSILIPGDSEEDPGKRSGKCKELDEISLPEGFEIVNMTIDYQRVCDMLDRKTYSSTVNAKRVCQNILNGDWSDFEGLI